MPVFRLRVGGATFAAGDGHRPQVRRKSEHTHGEVRDLARDQRPKRQRAGEQDIGVETLDRVLHVADLDRDDERMPPVVELKARPIRVGAGQALHPGARDDCFEVDRGGECNFVPTVLQPSGDPDHGIDEAAAPDRAQENSHDARLRDRVVSAQNAMSIATTSAT